MGAVSVLDELQQETEIIRAKLISIDFHLLMTQL